MRIEANLTVTQSLHESLLLAHVLLAQLLIHLLSPNNHSHEVTLVGDQVEHPQTPFVLAAESFDFQKMYVQVAG